MANPALVQTWGAFTSGSFNNEQAISGASTVAGNAILVAVSWGNPNPVTSVTDSQGNTYASIGQYEPGAIGNFSMQMFYALNIAGGPCTVTVSFAPSTTDYIRLHCHEVSGISAFDQSAQAEAGSGNIAIGPITPAVPNEFLLGYAVNNAGTAGSQSGNWLAGISEGSETTIYQVPASTAAISATYTGDGSNWFGQLMAFKPAGGGSTPSPLLMLLGCGA